MVDTSNIIKTSRFASFILTNYKSNWFLWKTIMIWLSCLNPFFHSSFVFFFVFGVNLDWLWFLHLMKCWGEGHHFILMSNQSNSLFSHLFLSLLSVFVKLSSAFQARITSYNYVEQSHNRCFSVLPKDEVRGTYSIKLPSGSSLK